VAVRSLLSWPGLIRAIVTNVRLSFRLLREPRVSLAKKAILVLVAAYFISPLDLIPDLLPVIGEVDDVAFALLALQFFVQICPPDAVAFHRTAIEQGQRFTRMPASGAVIDAEWKRED
jgi:uncharacterized membrane protein YkvA (DUF1232 family)